MLHLIKFNSICCIFPQNLTHIHFIAKKKRFLSIKKYIFFLFHFFIWTPYLIPSLWAKVLRSCLLRLCHSFLTIKCVVIFSSTLALQALCALLQLWPLCSPQPESVPLLATSFAASHGGREQSPGGGPHTEVGPKPKLNSRGSETKRNRNFWAAVQVMDYIPVICLVTTTPVEHLNRRVFLQKRLV